MTSLKLVRNVCLPFSSRGFYCILQIFIMEKRILKKVSASGTFLDLFFKIKGISASVFLLKKEFTCGLEMSKHINKNVV